eukprot:403357736
MFVGSVVCGCPLVICCLRLFVEVRFCKQYYKDTNGINCLELLIRGLCFCCCKFSQVNRKKDQDGLFGLFDEPEAGPQGGNLGEENDIGGGSMNGKEIQLVDLKTKPNSNMGSFNRGNDKFKPIEIGDLQERQPLTIEDGQLQPQ